VAVGSSGTQVVVTFDLPVSGVSLYLAYSTSVTVVAFDANNGSVGTVSTGTPTGGLGEGRFSVSGAGVRRLTVTSVDAKSFILDDLTYQTADIAPTFTGASLASQSISSGGNVSF